MSEKKSIIEIIRDDIEKTGFVSELNVVSILNKNDWDAYHSWIYQDDDENKSREIDVIGSTWFFDKEIDFSIEFILVIEVKKTSRPWIIFTSEYEAAHWSPSILVNGINVHKWVNSDTMDLLDSKPLGEKSIPIDIINYDPLKILVEGSEKNRIGKAFHELGKKPNEPSAIYAALMGLAKGTMVFDDFNIPNNSKSDNFTPENEKSVAVYLPIVVVDGKLYEVFNNKKSELQIIEKNFIPVDLGFTSKKYPGNKAGIRLTHSIVTLDSFDNYLKQLNIKADTLFRIFITDIARVQQFERNKKRKK